MPDLVFATLVSNRKALTDDIGTAQQISASDKPIRMLHVQADPDNSGNIAIGGADVSLTDKKGKILAPGEHYDMPINNLDKVWLDVGTSGDGILYNYYRD